MDGLRGFAMLLSYRSLVRYTVIGIVLNGQRD